MKTIHVCARCGARFSKRRDCWIHMDTECPNIPDPNKMPDEAERLIKLKYRSQDGANPFSQAVKEKEKPE